MRAEASLQQSEAQFRQLADAMPQLVWTANPDGQIDYYNRRHEEYDGIERLPDGTYQWHPVLHHDDEKPTQKAWEEAVRTGETYRIEHRVRLADGSYHWHLSRSIPVRDTQARQLSHELSPHVLTHVTLSASLKWLVRRFREQFNLRVDLDTHAVKTIENESINYPDGTCRSGRRIRTKAANYRPGTQPADRSGNWTSPPPQDKPR
jgi:PAS domain S-box-containing protein